MNNMAALKNMDPKIEMKRYGCAVIAAVICAVNINTFVNTGGLIPGGFNGVTLLIQSIFPGIRRDRGSLYGDQPRPERDPCFYRLKFIGLKFTMSSCVVILLSGILTDLIPAQPITYDPLLISIFGGLINGVVITLCLIGNTSTGGTDFIAIYFSEKNGRDIWNYIFCGNAILLVIAGLLFGWDKALYSIIFQFTSTQVVQILHQRYKKHTLFIVTRHRTRFTKRSPISLTTPPQGWTAWAATPRIPPP